MQLSGQLCRRSPCKAPLQGPHAPLLCLDLSDSLNEALAAEPLPGRRVGSGQPRSALRSRLPSNRHPRTTHGPAKPFWPRTAPLPAQAPPPAVSSEESRAPPATHQATGRRRSPGAALGRTSGIPFPRRLRRFLGDRRPSAPWPGRMRQAALSPRRLWVVPGGVAPQPKVRGHQPLVVRTSLARQDALSSALFKMAMTAKGSMEEKERPDKTSFPMNASI